MGAAKKEERVASLFEGMVVGHIADVLIESGKDGDAGVRVCNALDDLRVNAVALGTRHEDDVFRVGEKRAQRLRDID